MPYGSLTVLNGIDNLAPRWSQIGSVSRHSLHTIQGICGIAPGGAIMAAHTQT